MGYGEFVFASEKDCDVIPVGLLVGLRGCGCSLKGSIVEIVVLGELGGLWLCIPT